ncbi:MAG: zinc-binding dehydrogenase [Actinomycetota bacterium]
MDMMRAGRMVGLNEMVCEETEVWKPADGDLVVRTTYASICGSDLHVVCHGVMQNPLPCKHGFPGHEGIGEVLESHHPDFEPGDIVLTVPNTPVGTCFNEIQTLPAAYCLKMPDTDIPAAELLMAQQLGTVLWALRRQPVDVTGKTVAVMGQGSAGLFFTHLMRRAGAATVIASDLAPARMALSKEFGADHVIDNTDGALTAAVRDLTNGRGADFVIEAVGRAHTLAQSIDVVGFEGTMLWFGLPDTESPVPIDFNKFFRKRLSAFSYHGAQDEPALASFQAATDIITRGELDVSKVVSHVIDVEHIHDAFQLANDPGADDAVKVSLSFA